MLHQRRGILSKQFSVTKYIISNIQRSLENYLVRDSLESTNADLLAFWTLHFTLISPVIPT